MHGVNKLLQKLRDTGTVDRRPGSGRPRSERTEEYKGLGLGLGLGLGFVMLQEVREIWRTTSVQGLEGQGSKFKPYAPFSRKPMKMFEKLGLGLGLGFVMLQEVREIWRTTSVQGLEGQGSKFKPYAPFSRKPMEMFEKFT